MIEIYGGQEKLTKVASSNPRRCEDFRTVDCEAPKVCGVLKTADT